MPHDRLRLVEVLGQLPYASNTTVLAADTGGGRWVYKPDAGQSPLWDFPLGTLSIREVLAFELSEALEFQVVPETRLAEGPLGTGSAQRFLAEEATFDPRSLFRTGPDPRLWPFAVLDIIANNADRKLGHFLREQGTGKLWGIDHGLTFHAADKLRTVLWGFAGRHLPQSLIGEVARFQETSGPGLENRVRSLLSAREATALRRRVALLLENPIHPQPPEGRPAVPWPIW